MLVITIAVPDRGQNEMLEASEALRETAEQFGGQVLHAHEVVQDGEDLDPVPVR